MAAMSPGPQLEAVDEAWKRISGLRLRLRESVHFYQHHYRGKPWLIIADQQDERYFRCSADAEQLLRLLDGSRSVEQALLEMQQPLPQKVLQQDIVLLIANLKVANLLQDEAGTDVDEDADSTQQKRKPNPWLSPFAIKFALFDPDRFLEKTVLYLKPLFSVPTMLLWVALVVMALTTSWLHWQELVEHGQARFSDPGNLLWYWLLYPLIKTLHELAHAFTTKVWGGAVHEMGIMLLVFFPVPYVDSSAAHRFSSKNRRMLVSASGIMVEVFLASLALMLWVNTEPGLLHDMAFDIVIIGGLSTLVFNANPLLRFDGYYILSELIEIPNLATRSNQYLGYLFKRYALDIPGVRSPVTASGEVKWLVVYGICSAIYRLFISLFIALWVAGRFFIIGMVLALWAVATQLVYPATQRCYRLIPVAREAGRLKRLGIVAVTILLVVMASLMLPVGSSTYAEGIVDLPKNSLIRAGTDGIITRVLLTDGVHAELGATILKLENLELETRQDILLARLEEASARQKEILLQDRTQSEILKAKVSAIDAELKDVQAQLRNLEVTSATQGVVSLPLANDLPGRFVKRGEVIGYVADLRQVSARVVIPQSDIDAVRNNTRSIKVRLKSRPDEILAAQFLRELPQATDRLPSRLLGSGAGGDVAVDARDVSGVQTISNIFQVEIALPMRNSGNYLGQRIYVHFIYDPDSLGSQLLREIKQFMLQTPFV